MSAPVVDPRFHVPPRRVIALIVFAAAVFWFARPVMLPFVVGAIIAYAFSPYIDGVQARTGRSRVLIVAALYGLGLLVVVGIALAFAGPVSREIALLIRSGPDALTTALRQVLGSDSVTIGDLTLTVEQVAAQLQAAINAYLQTPEGALRAAQQLLHGTLDVILTMIVTFFLLLDGGRFGEAALRFLDPADRVQMRQVATRIHRVVGQWLRGQLVLVVLVAVVVSIVLGPILHLPNPAALGVMVGLLEVITFIGPIVAGAIVGIVALSTGGPTLAIVAILFLFALRQFENLVLMPAVLGRAVNLHPLVALFAVVVGSTAFGIVGTFLALPVAAAINVALHEFFPEELGALPGDVAVASGTSPVDPMAAVQPATQSPVEAPSARFTGQG
ncbi:MAG TPA: AI-2E family transporter [Candidatus Limnocylindrales bacterium]|nr:AI-2E family transporter [Candidatus Limnocylindrales bacterium]